jgi:hypothetical protein
LTTTENNENVGLLGAGLQEEKSDSDPNREFTDEERAKLNSIINIFAGKDEGQIGGMEERQRIVMDQSSNRIE